MRWFAVLLSAFVFGASALAGCTGGDSKGAAAGEPDFDLQATATTGVIRGLVVDSAIRPLEGVEVALTVPSGEAKTVKSDASGLFGFDGLPPGTYFLRAHKIGFFDVQQSAEVVAGESAPPIVKMLLAPNPSTAPYIEVYAFNGFISFGAAIGITSVGTTITEPTAEALGDTSIWTLNFTVVPDWAQGELVWEQNQPAGGMLIWEMVQGGTNNFRGHRETSVSPALAYWNTTVLRENASSVLDDGIAYRFFGGPHPLLGPAPNGTMPPEEQCPTIPTVVLGDRNPCRFGFGITVQQSADAYIHNFYNFVPPAGWRFTKDGDPEIPE